jgi:LemA protein
MKYESETLTKVAELRSEYNNDENKDLKKASKLNSEFNKILAVGENNPDLKASEEFLNLQKNISKMENQLQAARRVYNGDVTLYNTTINSFPNMIVAKMFGFKEFDLFEIEEYKKENIKVDL